MRTLAPILIILLAVLLPASGDDNKLPTLKVEDTIYTNVTVLRVTATDIYFSSASGISNAKLTSLEPDVQARFAPAAAKADEIDQKQSAANIAYEQAQALLAASQPAPVTPEANPTADSASSTTTTTNIPLAKLLLGQQAPQLTVATWISASPNINGKFVLVDFWNSTSEPCLSFIPLLSAFQQKFGDRLTVIGISDESQADVMKISDPKIEYSSAVDPQKQMASAIELKQVPYALLVDPGWTVRWQGNPVDSTNMLTDSTISSLLDKYATPPAQ